MAELKIVFTNLGLRKIDHSDRGYDFQEFAGFDPTVAISSQLGTEILSNIVFEAGSYTDRGQVINFEELAIDMVLITISQTKNIIRTDVQGRAGSVKEYVSLGDYVINIKAAIVSNDSEKYPADDVRKLHEILKAPIALKFRSEFIDRLGAFDLVVESHSLPQTQGFRNVQAVNINLLTDTPLEIKVNEEEKITFLTSESEKTIVETIIV